MGIPDEVFSGKPHRMRMGLRPLDLDTWLDNDPAHPQMASRHRLIHERRSEVYARTAGSEAHAATVAHAVAHAVGVPLAPDDNPLLQAALLVREDLCVLTHVHGSWRLVAAVVCFPSRWRLAEKMGQDVVGIHDPVPGYRRTLGQPTERVLQTPSPRWRVNWTLLDDPALFQPTGPQRRETVDESWFLRVERQCLVPIADPVAFTIRTDVIALRDLDAERRQAVLRSADQMPPEIAAYRGWESR